MAWDKILTGADQAQTIRTDMFICLPIATAAPKLRLRYFTLKRHLVQYQFSRSRVKIDFFRKFYVYSLISNIKRDKKVNMGNLALKLKCKYENILLVMFVMTKINSLF